MKIADNLSCMQLTGSRGCQDIPINSKILTTNFKISLNIQGKKVPRVCTKLKLIIMITEKVSGFQSIS